MATSLETKNVVQVARNKDADTGFGATPNKAALEITKGIEPIQITSAVTNTFAIATNLSPTSPFKRF